MAKERDGRVGVVIPVLNGFQDAIVALSRIRTKRIWTPYIGTQWDENKALSAVWNEQSMQAFKDGCTYSLVINDDAWVFPHTIDMLIERMQETGVLLVSATNTHEQAISKIEFNGNPAGLDFSCFLIHYSTFDRVGFFDENFYPAYFEDNDYHYRMKLLGLEAYGLADALFYHKDNGSNTVRRLPSEENFHRHFQNSRDYFIKKWGGMPDTPDLFTTPYNEGGSVKEWILQDTMVC